MTSVRRFLRRWLQRALDHLAEEPVQELRGAEVHPYSALDAGNARYFVAGAFDYASGQGQEHNSVALIGLCDQVNIQGGNTAVANFEPLAANCQSAVRFNDLLAHQNFPPEAFANYAVQTRQDDLRHSAANEQVGMADLRKAKS